MRFGLARAVAAVSTWGLRYVFRRPAANFPGKVALYVDPALVADLAPRVGASICVVGTNGKTTVTNLLAEAIEASGASVVCNRTGANLDSGVTTALLHGRGDWGVFECDELWLAKVLPGLQSRFVLLLNLFRDQLDRVGEIDHIQEAIAGALAASPDTVLIYNADDPLCQAIADRVSNRCVPFGVEGDLGLPPNTVADARMCQRCATMLEYDWRHYGQLGAFRCPACGFARVAPAVVGRVMEKGRIELGAPSAGEATCESPEAAQPYDSQVVLRAKGATGSFASEAAQPSAQQPVAPFARELDYGASSYMAYNLVAIWAACESAGVPFEALERAVAAFDPRNGRLQQYSIGGRSVLLNLAKNPTGFNQNLNIVLDGARDAALAGSAGRTCGSPEAAQPYDPQLPPAAEGATGSFASEAAQPSAQQPVAPSAVAFYINDKEADGRDVSWLWDIDFQNLASAVRAGELRVYAGGIRRNDMQVRLKYAGVPAELVDGAEDFLVRVPEGGHAFVIANYTALPGVKTALDRMADVGSVGEGSGSPEAAQPYDPQPSPTEPGSFASEAAQPYDSQGGSAGESSLVIAHMFPTLLNLYGDGGNVTVLAERARRRGIDVRVVAVDQGDSVDWDAVDIVYLGGGPDREQRLAAECLADMADELRAFVEDDGVVLAICGGFQIIGREWLMGEETVPGLGILGVTTRRAEGGSHNRLVGNIALTSPLAPEMPVVGYENHAGRTFLDEGVEPFGAVAGSHGHGNNDRDRADGALYRNVVGTYLHGPLLAKNPEVADELLRRALARQAAKSGASEPVELAPLDDAEERAANAYMCGRLGLRSVR